MDKLRIDKWLWAARFYKTRTLAVEEIERGRVRINDLDVKPAREVKAGDMVTVRQGTVIRVVEIKGVSSQRGSAPVAQQLYVETAASVLARAAVAEQHRIAADPASSLEHGRPTKRDRRDLDRARNKPDAKAWNDRWSASADS